MSTIKNPISILEAAKSIVAHAQQQPTGDKPIDPKLPLVNEEIVRIKTFIKEGNVENSFDNITNFVESCNEKGLLSDHTLQDIDTIGKLLELLQLKRKSLKENNKFISKSKESPVSNPFTQVLFSVNSQYTISALCKEFNCLPEDITSDFVEDKKRLCCKKITLLLSEYEYCDSLIISTEIYPRKFHTRYNTDDLVQSIEKVHMDFNNVSKTVEKAPHSAYPSFEDFNLNKTLINSLSHFKENIVNEIDNYCNKIDLVNNFINSMEKSKDINFS